MKEYTPRQIAEAELRLEGLQACVLDDLLKIMAGLAPTRTYYGHDHDLNQMILPINVTRDAESIIASMGNNWCSTRIMQTVERDNGTRASHVDLKDDDMDRLVALWLLYKLEKSEKK